MNKKKSGELLKEFKSDFKGLFTSVFMRFDEVTAYIPAGNIEEICRLLRDNIHYAFTQLIDITAVDCLGKKAVRFEVVYHLLSMKHNRRLRLKVTIDEDVAMPSLCDIWPSANWYEREVWDMYGIFFENHPDLRRILTDYGFDGHPQRKDFPLTGRVELRYDEKLGRIVYEPVKLAQDFRNFDFLSPWEGQNGAASSGAKKVKEDK